MNNPAPDPVPEAARWVMRQDRGLTAAEQDEFLEWLASDPRHAAALAAERRTWEQFDRLAGLETALPAAPDPDLLAPRPRHRRLKRAALFALPLAAAAALAFVLRTDRRPAAPEWPAPAAAPVNLARGLAPIEERTLEDGSVLRLNRGASVRTGFSAGARRVWLERGEASFAVAKDPARPFLVEAAGVSVRAIGTEFNVRTSERGVEVIVTEGRVAVASLHPTAAPAPAEVAAGQRALVPADPAAWQVDTPPAEEIARRLAWQPRLLTFSDEPLATIVAEFNRHNPVALRLADPALRELRLTARFRSDNVEGFVRLLASDFGVRAELSPDGGLVLRTR